MSESLVDTAFDPQLEKLKSSRNSSAVVKLELAKLRACVPTIAILVFEGDDDKLVYAQWLRRVRADLEYAMLPCRGKGALLALRAALASDRTGLASRIYFFADRDFDDLRGQLAGPDIFLTDRYSVENYLVTEEVLRCSLEVEFHCHATPGLRDEIVAMFRKDYEEFLALTKEANRRLFVARRLKIEIKNLPTSIGKLAAVNLRDVKSGSLAPEEVVAYLAEPNPHEVAILTGEFEELEPTSRYRGKFALLFFSQWLRKLANEASLDGGGIFAPLTNRASIRAAELTLNTHASRSPLPLGFADFVSEIESRIAA